MFQDGQRENRIGRQRLRMSRRKKKIRRLRQIRKNSSLKTVTGLRRR